MDVVEQQPAAVGIALASARLVVPQFAHAIDHVVRDRLGLARVGAGTDDEEVGVAHHATQIDEANVGGKLLDGGLRKCPREGGGIQFLHTSPSYGWRRPGEPAWTPIQ